MVYVGCLASRYSLILSIHSLLPRLLIHLIPVTFLAFLLIQINVISSYFGSYPALFPPLPPASDFCLMKCFGHVFVICLREMFVRLIFLELILHVILQFCYGREMKEDESDGCWSKHNSYHTAYGILAETPAGTAPLGRCTWEDNIKMH